MLKDYVKSTIDSHLGIENEIEMQELYSGLPDDLKSAMAFGTFKRRYNSESILLGYDCHRHQITVDKYTRVRKYYFTKREYTEEIYSFARDYYYLFLGKEFHSKAVINLSIPINTTFEEFNSVMYFYGIKCSRTSAGTYRYILDNSGKFNKMLKGKR